jgi:hypothetical protein
MFQTKVVEIHFFPKNCAVCEITWKNVVDLDRP